MYIWRLKMVFNFYNSSKSRYYISPFRYFVDIMIIIIIIGNRIYSRIIRLFENYVLA